MREFQPDHLPQPRGLEPFELPAMPLDIEIGAGSGDFAIQYALNNPSRYLVAIEHTKNRFSRFKDKLNDLGSLSNLTAVNANGISWVSYQLKPATVDKFFFMYPNPNPKKKHQNKRWHAMPFMGKVIETLKPEGEIFLATNESWYIEEAAEFFQKVWNLNIIDPISFTQDEMPFPEPRTLFEKKYLERGETCYQLRALKNH